MLIYFINLFLNKLNKRIRRNFFFEFVYNSIRNRK